MWKDRLIPLISLWMMSRLNRFLQAKSLIIRKVSPVLKLPTMASLSAWAMCWAIIHHGTMVIRCKVTRQWNSWNITTIVTHWKMNWNRRRFCLTGVVRFLWAKRKNLVMWFRMVTPNRRLASWILTVWTKFLRLPISMDFRCVDMWCSGISRHQRVSSRKDIAAVALMSRKKWWTNDLNFISVL